MNHKQSKVITIFKQHTGNISKVCRLAGISRITFYRWMKLDEFRESIEMIIDEYYNWIQEVCNNACKERQCKKVVKYKHKTITTTWTVLPTVRTVLMCTKLMWRIDEYYEKRYIASTSNNAIKPICKVIQLPQYKMFRLAA